MNDKPVAWRIKDKDGKWMYYDEALVGTEALYAHPPKINNEEEENNE